MNKEEFKVLYDQYFDAIRNYVFYRGGRTDIASDIAQEVFLKVWKKQLEYNPSTLKNLLYKMANDAFIDKSRRNKTEENYLIELKFKNKNFTGENSLEFKELKSLYEHKLNQLTDKQRSTFLMSRHEQLSYKEIAERLQISQKTVEKRISEVLKIMRATLQNNEINK